MNSFLRLHVNNLRSERDGFLLKNGNLFDLKFKFSPAQQIELRGGVAVALFLGYFEV
jgi:hypothetical protein